MSQIAWRKSTRSGSGSDCVELARIGDTCLVRDSKDPGGPMLALEPAALHELLARVKAGELDT